MQTQEPSSATIRDPVFNQLLKEASDNFTGVPVRGVGEIEGFIVSKREYEQISRIKQEARNRFWEMTEEIRTRVAQSGLTEEEIEARIDKAIREVRAEKKKKSFPPQNL